MDEIRDIREKVEDIHRVIAGNPQYGQPGIKDILKDHTDRLEKLEKGETKRMFKAGFIGSGITLSSVIVTVKVLGAKTWAAIVEIIF